MLLSGLGAARVGRFYGGGSSGTSKPTTTIGGGRIVSVTPQPSIIMPAPVVLDSGPGPSVILDPAAFGPVSTAPTDGASSAPSGGAAPAAGLPKWAIPVGVGAIGLLLFLALRKPAPRVAHNPRRRRRRHGRR